MPLTSSVSETFQENGFVAQVDVLDADETQQFQQNFTELQESIGKFQSINFVCSVACH